MSELTRDRKYVDCVVCHATGTVPKPRWMFWVRSDTCPLCKGEKKLWVTTFIDGGQSPKMSPYEYCAKVAKAEPVAIDTEYPRHLASLRRTSKLVREILEAEKATITKAKPRQHPAPKVEVPIELIRDLANQAWMRNDIRTADKLFGLLGADAKTATQHEMEDAKR